MTTIQIRIDEQTKKSSAKILDAIGIDMSAAIKMFLKQVVFQKGIPFRVVTENGLTLEQEDLILRRRAEAKRGVNVTKSMRVDEVAAFLTKK
jgi:DNA-damage-inducible protein J